MTGAQTQPPQEPEDQRGSGWRAGFRSLRFKASLLVVLAVVIITTAGVAITTRTMGLALYENEYSRTREWARSLAAGTSDAVEAGDRESLTHTVNDLLGTRTVACAAITDSSGEVLASAETSAGLLNSAMMPDGQTLKLEPMHTPRLAWYPDLKLACAEVVVPVYSTTPIRRTGRTSRPIVGYLRLAADVSDTKAQLERIGDQLCRIGIGLVLLAVPCSLLVTRHVVAPLNELAQTARAIAHGSVDARAHIHSNNEIGELSKSFNTMADRLTASQLELLQLNAELEKRVQERTRELEDLAARDPLTGLYNRRHFSEVITREFAAAERYDADLTCLMFDLDYFKEINDKFGHRTGDEVLITLAGAIGSELRGADVAARFGGDEFVLLLPQTAASAAYMLVDRIVSRFNHDTQTALPGVPASVSVGVASLRTTRAASAEALLHEADVALYAAKEASRNQVMGPSHPAVAQAGTAG